MIDSIITVLKKQQADDETLTIDLDVHQWIDRDGNQMNSKEWSRSFK